MEGKFFSGLSPLVEYEVKAGDTRHLEFIDACAALGYCFYWLIPRLDVLAPFLPGITTGWNSVVLWFHCGKHIDAITHIPELAFSNGMGG